MNPSGVNANPDPAPCVSRGEALRRRCCTSTLSTAGATRSTTPLTVREYASSNSASAGDVGGSGDCGGVAGPPPPPLGRGGLFPETPGGAQTQNFEPPGRGPAGPAPP